MSPFDPAELPEATFPEALPIPGETAVSITIYALVYCSMADGTELGPYTQSHTFPVNATAGDVAAEFQAIANGFCAFSLTTNYGINPGLSARYELTAPAYYEYFQG